MASRIKKNDMVEVIAGDDCGVKGKVLEIDYENQRILIEGVNRVYKHVKPSRRNPQGGRLHVERPIHISNVLPVSAKSNKGVRVHYQVDAAGKKIRVGSDGSTSIG